MGLDLSLNCHADTGNRHRGQEKWKFEYTVKVVPNLAAEKCGKSTEFPRPGTNRTQLQLIRSCTFLLDPGVPISKCQSAEVHQDFPMQRMCARVRSYIGISDARMIEIKARV